MAQSAEKLAPLRSAVEAIKSCYYINGKYSTDSLTIKLKDDGKEIQLPVKYGDQEAHFAPLLKVANAAPFGRASETVIDANIRKASQLLPEQFSLGWSPPESLLQQIKDQLIPDAENVEARLHKINIYTTGGHFKSHKDTPNSDSQFGTLVIQLPTFFEGGQLVLTHQENVVTALAPEVSHRRYGEKPEDAIKRMNNFVPKNMHWAAFFGDVTHQVKQVTAGCRITITYVLHRTGAVLKPSEALLARAENVRRAFVNLLADTEFESEGATLGFDCNHLYEEKQLATSENKLAADNAENVSIKTASTLKNEDAVLAVAARAAGLQVKIYRILSESCCGDFEWLLKKMPASDRGFGKKRRVDGGFYAKGITNDEIEDFGGTLLEDSNENLIMVKYDNNAKKRFSALEWAAEGYFGNEASTTTFYTKSVIAIRIPEISKRNTCDKPLTLDRVLLKESTKKKRKAHEALENDDDEIPSIQPSKRQTDERRQPRISCASTPPVLFPPTTASSRDSTPRTIHIIGGRGNTKCDQLNGKCDIILQPGEGVRELKSKIRKVFGKYSHHTMSSLHLVSNGQPSSVAAKASDLVDGVTLQCTYSYTTGNISNLRSSRGGWGRTFGDPWMMMLMNHGRYF
eukprot:CAMPEP_0197288444 /NCGR_PEP_ID=MMETSP0890-20130614/5542_1 /TAXON_ID=44058 ORGANISM="Aureoumbra lagunensis, Strain CCMP1510" /NCGR_SAMPLE_ID=MMETSP0890 /ASSEMBLY_ACC=CAM_ASM_000533 /LENGTH=628 /DNA_ID=CAMNT_0042759181 /DNA_START=48 /DNA_END=1935 /DNA_ORIENTATION=+